MATDAKGDSEAPPAQAFADFLEGLAQRAPRNLIPDGKYRDILRALGVWKADKTWEFAKSGEESSRLNKWIVDEGIEAVEDGEALGGYGLYLVSGSERRTVVPVSRIPRVLAGMRDCTLEEVLREVHGAYYGITDAVLERYLELFPLRSEETAEGLDDDALSDAKRCSKCQLIKRKSEFHRDCSKPSLVRSRCKTCCSALKTPEKPSSSTHKSEGRDWSSPPRHARTTRLSVAKEKEKEKEKERNNTAFRGESSAANGGNSTGSVCMEETTAGSKMCSRCLRVKPYWSFCKDKSKPLGIRSRCRECAREKVVEDFTGTRKCWTCKHVKPLSSFQKAGDSFQGSCKKCRAPSVPSSAPPRNAMCAGCGLRKSPLEFDNDPEHKPYFYIRCRTCMANNVPIKNKECSKCNRDLPLSEYYRDAYNRTGFKSQCKNCAEGRKPPTEKRLSNSPSLEDNTFYKELSARIFGNKGKSAKKSAAPAVGASKKGEGSGSKPVEKNPEKKAARLEDFMDIGGKYCSKCQVFKPFANFTRDASQKSGYKSRCKECRKKRNVPEPPPPATALEKNSLGGDVEEKVEEKIPKATSPKTTSEKAAVAFLNSLFVDAQKTKQPQPPPPHTGIPEPSKPEAESPPKDTEMAVDPQHPPLEQNEPTEGGVDKVRPAPKVWEHLEQERRKNGGKWPRRNRRNNLIKNEDGDWVKYCSSCKEMRKAELYRRDKSKVSGLRSRCRICEGAALPGKKKNEKEGGAKGKVRGGASKLLTGTKPDTKAKTPNTVNLNTSPSQLVEKICTCCHRMKSPAEFNRDNSKVSGLSSWCKKCTNSRVKRASRSNGRAKGARRSGRINPNTPTESDLMAKGLTVDPQGGGLAGLVVSEVEPDVSEDRGSPGIAEGGECGPVGTQVCSKCGEEKVAGQFYQNPSVAAGLFAWCKECCKGLHLGGSPTPVAKKVPKRRCARCRKLRSALAFVKDLEQPNRLRVVCSQCFTVSKGVSSCIPESLNSPLSKRKRKERDMDESRLLEFQLLLHEVKGSVGRTGIASPSVLWQGNGTSSDDDRGNDPKTDGSFGGIHLPPYKRKKKNDEGGSVDISRDTPRPPSRDPRQRLEFNASVKSSPVLNGVGGGSVDTPGPSVNPVLMSATVRVLEKQCIHCGLVKSADCFQKNRSSKTGLASWCIDCKRQNPKKGASRSPTVEGKTGTVNLDIEQAAMDVANANEVAQREEKPEVHDQCNDVEVEAEVEVEVDGGNDMEVDEAVQGQTEHPEVADNMDQDTGCNVDANDNSPSQETPGQRDESGPANVVNGPDLEPTEPPVPTLDDHAPPENEQEVPEQAANASPARSSPNLLQDDLAVDLTLDEGDRPVDNAFPGLDDAPSNAFEMQAISDLPPPPSPAHPDPIEPAEPDILLNGMRVDGDLHDFMAEPALQDQIGGPGEAHLNDLVFIDGHEESEESEEAGQGRGSEASGSSRDNMNPQRGPEEASGSESGGGNVPRIEMNGGRDNGGDLNVAVEESEDESDDPQDNMEEESEPSQHVLFMEDGPGVDRVEIENDNDNGNGHGHDHGHQPAIEPQQFNLQSDDSYEESDERSSSSGEDGGDDVALGWGQARMHGVF